MGNLHTTAPQRTEQDLEPAGSAASSPYRSIQGDISRRRPYVLDDTRALSTSPPIPPPLPPDPRPRIWLRSRPPVAADRLMAAIFSAEAASGGSFAAEVSPRPAEERAPPPSPPVQTEPDGSPRGPTTAEPSGPPLLLDSPLIVQLEATEERPSPQLTAVESGDDRQEGDDKLLLEEDVDVGSQLDMMTPLDHGFYFGISTQVDPERRDFFHQVHDATYPSALRSSAPDARSEGSEENARLPSVAEEEPVSETEEGAIEDTLSANNHSAATKRAETSMDVSNMQPALDGKTREKIEQLPGSQGFPELLEIARLLTAASSSLPEPESLHLFEGREGTASGQEDVTEGAGDDSLKMDLKQVAGGMFDPVVSSQVGCSLPPQQGQQPPDSGADMNIDEKPPVKEKKNHGPLKACGKSVAHNEEKCPRSVDSSIVCARAETTYKTTEQEPGQVGVVEGARGSDTMRTSEEDRRAEFVPNKPKQRHLAGVIQGLKQAIIPRLANGRSTIAKKVRTRRNVETRAETSMSDDDSPAMEITATPQIQGDDLRRENDALQDSSKTVTIEKSEQTPKVDSCPTSDPSTNISTTGIKKNDVGALSLSETRHDRKSSLSIKSAVRQNKPHASESRTSRSSIAPPRTNFLSEDVLKSLAKTSYMRVSDITLRPSLRLAERTPERYRNIPPSMKRTESIKSNLSAPSRTSSPRSQILKKRNTNKRFKESNMSIKHSSTEDAPSANNVREERVAATALDIKTATRVPSVQSAATKLSKMNKPRDQVVRKFKRGLSTPAVTISNKSLPVRRQQSSIVSKRIQKEVPSNKLPVTKTIGYRKIDRVRIKQRELASVALKQAKKASASNLSGKPKQLQDKVEQSCPQETTNVISSASVEVKSAAIPESHGASKAESNEANQMNNNVIPSCLDDSKMHSNFENSSKTMYTLSSLESSKTDSNKRTSSNGEFSFTSGRGKQANVSREKITQLTSRGVSPISKRIKPTPRYRPTLRTPRISGVGMNTGPEPTLILRKKSDIEVIVGTPDFTKMQLKNVQKKAHAMPVQHPQDHSKIHDSNSESKQADPFNQLTSHENHTDLHEVARMLYEYATLTAASRGSFSSVSRLVSLFEAPTTDSVPSEGRDSSGGLCTSSHLSIDNVLEDVKRYALDNTSNDNVLKENETVSLQKDSCSDSRDEEPEVSQKSVTLTDDHLSGMPERSTEHSYKICSTETEVRCAAALQEIMRSLTDLRKTEILQPRATHVENATLEVQFFPESTTVTKFSGIVTDSESIEKGQHVEEPLISSKIIESTTTPTSGTATADMTADMMKPSAAHHLSTSLSKLSIDLMNSKPFHDQLDINLSGDNTSTGLGSENEKREPLTKCDTSSKVESSLEAPDVPCVSDTKKSSDSAEVTTENLEQSNISQVTDTAVSISFSSESDNKCITGLTRNHSREEETGEKTFAPTERPPSLTMMNTKQQCGDDHLHCLSYVPSQRSSSFEMTEGLTTHGCQAELSRDAELDSKSVASISREERMQESRSVQAESVPTADADCQMEYSSAIESEDIFTDASEFEDYQDASNFESPRSDLTEKSFQPDAVRSETVEQTDLEKLLEVYMPTDSSLIPRSHSQLLHQTVRSQSNADIPFRVTSRSELLQQFETGKGAKNVTSPAVETYAEPTTSGIERAQKRIACLLDCDLSTAVIALLNDVIPFFLKRSESELQSPRQTQLSHILCEDYLKHPVNASIAGRSPQNDPQARHVVEWMSHQVALLLEDTARSAEVLGTGQRPP